MKLKTFWKSLCALILAFLIIMAFYRGPQLQWLMVGALGLWAAFVAISLLRTMLTCGFLALGTFLIKKTHSNKELRDDASQLIIENRELKIALMNQIIVRITENLHTCSPDAAWKWAENNPTERILNYEPCRIRISNVEDFNFADVQIGTKGELAIEFGKKVALNDIQKKTSNDETTIEDWFNSKGNKIISDFICDLSADSQTNFSISKTGIITVGSKTQSRLLEEDFPASADNLPKLKTLLAEINVKSDITGGKLVVSV